MGKKGKALKKAEKLMNDYANNLEAMGDDAKKIDTCGDCDDCKDFTKCIKGIRFGIADLAETIAWIIREMHKLDTSVMDIISLAPEKPSEPDYFQ